MEIKRELRQRGRDRINHRERTGNYISVPQAGHPENLRRTKTFVTVTFQLFQKCY